MGYQKFLESKTQLGGFYGFEPISMPDFLFDFQKSLIDWSLRKGKAAIFADCGLGKTAIQLVWADNVVRKTNRPVLILTPIAVSYQTANEANKFNIEAYRSPDGKIHKGINITNYERLHYFNPEDFSGVVCDESSILKSFDGKYRNAITQFMRKIPYRLLCTATAAPNDYMELGTSSEALGELGYTDMLGKFFKNDQQSIKAGRSKRFDKSSQILNDSGKWRFKGHAEIPFWKWVCSWARAIRRPSDLGFDDSRFVLPELIEEEHEVEAPIYANGLLFPVPAVGLKEQRIERRNTINQRCEKVGDLVNGTGKPALAWCHMNDEGHILEDIIPDSIQVSGQDSDEEKEEKFMAFSSGQSRVLITKPKIGALGLNLQQCIHISFFPSHSFEQYYQGIRRCWRFGQKKPVKVDIITTEGDQNILKNLQRKSNAANKMFSELVGFMNQAQKIERAKSYTVQEEIPSWL